MTRAKPVPDGYHTVTPYLSVEDPGAALAFYEKAFGATVTERHADEQGNVRHAEIQVGDSRLMVAGAFEWLGLSWKGPKALGGSTISLYLYVDDVDAWVKRAIESGARELNPVSDQYYGDRNGGVVDPWGHVWWLATHVEDLSPEEIDRRGAAARNAS